MSDTPSNPTPPPDDQRRQRRRLLKGLAAGLAGGVAVATLRNQARAAFASNLDCIQVGPTLHTNNPPNYSDRCVTNGDPEGPYVRWNRSDFNVNGWPVPSVTLDGGANALNDRCLIYVDEDGFVNNNNVQSWGQGQLDHHIVTTSCWASFT